MVQLLSGWFKVDRSDVDVDELRGAGKSEVSRGFRAAVSSAAIEHDNIQYNYSSHNMLSLSL